MSTGIKTNQFNILVIEDDDQAFDAIKNGLSDTDYKLFRVNTGSEALKIVKDGHFLAVVTELMIIDMNGIELVKRLKQLLGSINVICLSTYTFLDTAVKALGEGAFAYLLKPLHIDELKLMLKRAIENSLLTAQVKQKGYYQDMSVTDGLTGVYNHRYFYEMLNWHINHLRRSPQMFSLLIIDIDNFKKYNDSHGHVEGDKVLRDTAQLFLNTTRENDMVFRYGGEEFSIILTQTDQHLGEIAGERILAAVRRRMPITVSMGLATFPIDAQTQNDLVVNADKALYRAKSSGKDRLCVFDKNIDR
jgi:two-component system, cell cycle response regulator